MLIHELAKTAGLPKDTIRYYTKLELLSPRARQAGSRTYADYDESALKTLKQIKFAKAAGFTLSEIRTYLVDITSGKIDKAELIDILKTKLAEIKTKQDHLRHTERILTNMIAKYQASLDEHH